MAYTYSKLAETTVGAGGASTITFSNIPQNYTDLVIRISGKSSFSSAGYDDLTARFNGSATGYSNREVDGTGSVTGSSSNQYASSGYAFLGPITSVNSIYLNIFNNGDIYIPNYAGSNYKSFSVDNVIERNATATAMYMIAGLWSNVTAINSIALNCQNGSFSQYSTATLYGIRVEI